MLEVIRIVVMKSCWYISIQIVSSVGFDVASTNIPFSENAQIEGYWVRASLGLYGRNIGPNSSVFCTLFHMDSWMPF